MGLTDKRKTFQRPALVHLGVDFLVLDFFPTLGLHYIALRRDAPVGLLGSDDGLHTVPERG